MSEPELVDSHCHLDFPDFDGALVDVVARARNAGVARMVTICTDPRNVAGVRAIAEAHAGVYFAVGMHPMNVGKAPAVDPETLAALAEHPRCVGIGETGLDYHYTAETAKAQGESLRVHVEASRRTGLPLIVHARDADEDVARILGEEHAAGPFCAVMHCFSSSEGLARTALELGFYLSASGILTFAKSDELRAIFAACPRDRLLVETDSPYLAPAPHRGRRNEPAYVAHTARSLAGVLGMEFAEVADQTTRNFDRLFPKAAREAGR